MQRGESREMANRLFRDDSPQVAYATRPVISWCHPGLFHVDGSNPTRLLWDPSLASRWAGWDLVGTLPQSRVYTFGAGKFSTDDKYGHRYMYLAIQMNVLIRYRQCYVYLAIQMIAVIVSQSWVGVPSGAPSTLLWILR